LRRRKTDILIVSVSGQKDLPEAVRSWLELFSRCRSSDPTRQKQSPLEKSSGSINLVGLLPPRI
jgi:hypothetical protein